MSEVAGALAAFRRSHPQYQSVLQYAPCNAEIETTLAFFNYYGQVFQAANAPAHLHFFCFDTDGREQHSASVPVESSAGVQIRLADFGPPRDGIVAAVAVPDVDLDALNTKGLKLRARLSTGFYVMWRDRSGHVDVMHEWGEVKERITPASRHFVGFRAGDGCVEHGLVLINPVFGVPAATATPRIGVRDPHRKTLDVATAAGIPPMGSRLLVLEQLFPRFGEWLQQHGRLVVSVETENALPPLTFERHRSGAFHIHHC